MGSKTMSSSGFTFLEILFSLFLISMLLLGMDALLFSSLREAKINLYYGSAIQQLTMLRERLKIMPEQQDREVAHWNKENAQLLPQGRGTVFQQEHNKVIVVVWGGEQEKNCQQNKIGIAGCLKIIF